ncbi:MAG: four-carbon acid sugar kinase family protein, partial [Bacillota bacterium]
MLKTLIVADDNTGANASAILLNDLNFSTLSLIDFKEAKVVEGYDGIAVGTDSRATDPDTAYKRVSHVLNAFTDENPIVLNKRVDSTLRGNLGSELNAFKDTFPNRKIAIVPSFPKSKRICKDGLLYVNDTLLENTDVAKDPKMPIHTSDVKALFEKQFNGTIANITREALTDEITLLKTITKTYQTHDAVIFDALSDEDIDTIANALMKSDLSIITVDPGVFTYAYTKAAVASLSTLKKRYVFMVGSVTDTTHNQIKHAETDEDFLVVPLDPEAFIEPKSAHEATQKAIRAFEETQKPYVLYTTNAPGNRKILDLFSISKEKAMSVDEVSKDINKHLAILLERLLDKHKDIGGLFTSGGDTTLSFLNHINARGIHLKKQVMPLCVYGTIVGGPFEGTPIITKGGMIGGDNAFSDIKK